MGAVNLAAFTLPPRSGGEGRAEAKRRTGVGGGSACSSVGVFASSPPIPARAFGATRPSPPQAGGGWRLPTAREAPNHAFTRGAGRTGPCNPGGVSPSLHPALQSVTGPLFTGGPQAHRADFQFGFLEPKSARWAGVPSSGPRQSRDETKAIRPASLVIPHHPLSPLVREIERRAASAERGGTHLDARAEVDVAPPLPVGYRRPDLPHEGGGEGVP